LKRQTAARKRKIVREQLSAAMELKDRKEIISVFPAFFRGNEISDPCKPMSGKPTVATVPPRSPVRLAAMGSGLKERLKAVCEPRCLTCGCLSRLTPAAIDWMAWVEHRMARGGFPI
jgi:hypothetical protein